jgi:hypothetical protein
MPVQVQDLLRVTNGAVLFLGALSVYGYRRTLSRDPANPQPLSIETPNTVERPKGAPSAALFIAFYNSDGSRAWVDSATGSVHRSPRHQWAPSLNTWPSVFDWLSTEVRRINLLFNDQGLRIDPKVPTVPTRLST